MEEMYVDHYCHRLFLSHWSELDDVLQSSREKKVQEKVWSVGFYPSLFLTRLVILEVKLASR